LSGVTQEVTQHEYIQSIDLLLKACVAKAQQYSFRHTPALEALAAGNIAKSAEEGLHLPYYLVSMILKRGFNFFSNGLGRQPLHQAILEVHHRPEGVRGSDMSNLLHTLALLQANKGISPPIFDYDRSQKLLQVVDSTFYFYLKNTDLNDALQNLHNPAANS
jgi:hypothetical protein